MYPARMDIYDQTLQWLKNPPRSYPQMAKDLGLTAPYLRRMARGDYSNPGYHNVVAIYRYLRDHQDGIRT